MLRHDHQKKATVPSIFHLMVVMVRLRLLDLDDSILFE